VALLEARISLSKARSFVNGRLAHGLASALACGSTPRTASVIKRTSESPESSKRPSIAGVPWHRTPTATAEQPKTDLARFSIFSTVSANNVHSGKPKAPRYFGGRVHQKARRNAAPNLRACRYRDPRRQPSRLCCSSRLRSPCRPYLGGSRPTWSEPTCTYDLCSDDVSVLLQVRTCLRLRTQKPMLLSQVSWSFSLISRNHRQPTMIVWVPNRRMIFCSKPSSARQKAPSCSHLAVPWCRDTYPTRLGPSYL
jgi:hypothetical protein